MAQLTVRLDDALAAELKAHAHEAGKSLNGWVTAVLRAAVDPELEESEAARTRARLARAGLLVAHSPRPAAGAPDPERVRRAREAAARGTPLSELVSDGRG
jgi:plasmid stability protein